MSVGTEVGRMFAVTAMSGQIIPVWKSEAQSRNSVSSASGNEMMAAADESDSAQRGNIEVSQEREALIMSSPTD